MPNENNIPIAAVAININEDDLVLAQEINHSSNIIVAERAENYDLSGNNEILVAYQDIDFNNVDRTTIDVILHKRSKLLKMFWVILLFNIILFFFNPTSIVCCITLVYNIFKIKFPESLLLESAIICNFLINKGSAELALHLLVSCCVVTLQVMKLPLDVGFAKAAKQKKQK